MDTARKEELLVPVDVRSCCQLGSQGGAGVLDWDTASRQPEIDAPIFAGPLESQGPTGWLPDPNALKGKICGWS